MDLASYRPRPSTFPKGGWAPPRLEHELSPAGSSAVLMVRPIRAHDAVERARALHTTKPIFPGCPCVHGQGFGKRKSEIGMPRPKKAKAQQLVESGLDENTGITGDMQVEESGGAALLEQEGHTLSESEEEEEKEGQKAANDLVKMARAEAKTAAMDVRVAEACLRAEKRRAEERDRCWWAAEQRDEPPPAYLQLERAYKAQVKMLQARLALSEAQKGAAEANARLQESLLMREQHAHAYTRCKLL